jgi:hypothetical protein
MNMCNKSGYDSGGKRNISKNKLIETLFSIPIYLRKEDDYYKAEEEAIKKATETARPFGQHTRVMESGKWPPWEFNDIVRYLQIGIDDRGYFIFCVFGIDHKHGYKRIPNAGERRNSVMWGIDYKKYFRGDIIKDHGGNLLKIDVPESRIKAALENFLEKMREKLEKEKRFLDIEHWRRMVKCLDIQTFYKMRQY